MHMDDIIVFISSNLALSFLAIFSISSPPHNFHQAREMRLKMVAGMLAYVAMHTSVVQIA